jgi:flagellar M-ring protein FliF
VDSRGQLLAKGGDENDSSSMSDDAEDFRVAYEKRVRSTIERLLEQSIGVGKVKAEVTADIDFDRTVRNKEVYDPEGQVARSVQSVSESERENETDKNQNVSVGNNLPNANASDASGSTNQRDLNRNEETTNFEISKEVINSIKETGTVNRLSVAVLVDGVYTTAEDGTLQYAERDAKELETLTKLVQSAIGFNAQRGDEVRVVNMRFASSEEGVLEEEALAWLKDDLSGIIQTLVLGGVAILAILMIIRPLVIRALENAAMEQEFEEEDQKLLAATSAPLDRLTSQADLDESEEEDMINIDRIQGKVR